MVKGLKRITFGTTTIPESWMFTGGDEAKAVPIVLSVFLLETETGKILVDAGCDTMPGFVVENHIGPVAALREAGVAPEEITAVILTHAHHDHIEAVSAFPNATVYIQKLEYAVGRDYIPPSMPVVLFEDTFLIDQDVRIVCSGGHCAGSCVVECSYMGKQYVLCGDECYSFYNLRNRVPTAITYDRAKSLAFVEKYASAQYTCLLCHQKEMDEI